MDSPDSSPLDRVSSSIKQLYSAAQNLNVVSGELGQAIAAIDTVLQNLNIGVPTWTRISGGSGHSGDYWHRDLGYAKVSNRWGISLRDVSGDYDNPDDERYDCWLFNDAPRWLRIEGIEKIPDLIEALITNTKETAEKIRSKTVEANKLAEVIAVTAGGEKRAAKGIVPAAAVKPAASLVASPLEPVPAVAPPSLSVGSVVSVRVSPLGGVKRPKGGK